MLIPLSLGLAVGMILSLIGAGGGIFAVPLLVFGSYISVAQSGPIRLMAVGMAAALGAILGLRAGVVRYRAALWFPARSKRILWVEAVVLLAFVVLAAWLASTSPPGEQM